MIFWYSYNFYLDILFFFYCCPRNQKIFTHLIGNIPDRQRNYYRNLVHILYGLFEFGRDDFVAKGLFVVLTN